LLVKTGNSLLHFDKKKQALFIYIYKYNIDQ